MCPSTASRGPARWTWPRACKTTCKYMEEHCPPGTKLHFVMDQSVYVTEAIHALIHEGLIGAVLVSIMILIFLGNWRMTLIASMSIPLALLGAIIGLYVTGNTINAMTLGGLALAIGPLVDDAIVELENNHRNYSLGKSRVRAALDGCAEVMIPVLVATFTTNIVLAPVALDGGHGRLPVPAAGHGRRLRHVRLVPAVAYLCADDVRQVPARRSHRRHAAAAIAAAARLTNSGSRRRSRRARPTTFFGRVHHRIESFLDNLTQGYQKLLRLAIRYRFLVLGAVGALFLGSLALGTRLGREFFPQVDAGQVTIYLRAPSNTRLDAAERRVAEAEEFIKKQIPEDEREMIVSEMGVTPDWSAAYTENSGQQDAIIRVQLSDERTSSAPRSTPSSCGTPSTTIRRRSPICV